MSDPSARTMPPAMPPPGAYAPQMPQKRPLGVTILAVLTIIFGLLGFLGGILLVVLFAAASTMLAAEFQAAAGLLLGLAALLTIVSLVSMIAGVGLLRLRSWAWWLTIIVGVLSIVTNIGTYVLYPIAIPYGIVLWVIILAYLVTVRNRFGIGQSKPAGM
jgi:hypothetical protein